MYVCVCKAVTDHQIRCAVRDGIISFRELRMELGVATCCGRCAPTAKQVMAEALGDEFPERPKAVVLPRSRACAFA